MYKSLFPPMVTFLALTTFLGSTGMADSTAITQPERPVHQLGEWSISAEINQPNVPLVLIQDDVEIERLAIPELQTAYQEWRHSQRQYQEHQQQQTQFIQWLDIQRLATQKGQLDRRLALRREAKVRLKSLSTNQPRRVARNLVLLLHQANEEAQIQGAVSKQTDQDLDTLSSSLANGHQEISQRLRAQVAQHRAVLSEALLAHDALDDNGRLVLAQLHAQQTKEQWFESQEGARRSEDQSGPKPDYTPSILLLQDVVADPQKTTQLDSALYLLSWYLASGGVSQTEQSIHHLRQLIRQFPNSPHVHSARLHIGRYEFQKNRNFAAAESHFDALLSEPNLLRSLNEQALYYLAWSQHHQAHLNHLEPYHAAISTWATLLNHHSQQPGPIASGMIEEAIQMTALAIFDLSHDSGNALETIQSQSDKWPNEEHQFEIYQTLLHFLSEHDRNQETIDLAATMLNQWPLAPQNPSIHWMLIEHLGHGSTDQSDQINQELKAFSIRFAADSPWTKANRKQKDTFIHAQQQWRDIALDRAAKQIAAGWERDPANPKSGHHASHREAQAHYTQAAQLLGALIDQQSERLSTTPETQRSYADVLFRLGQYDKAWTASSALHKSNEMTPDTGALQLRILEQLIPSKFGAIGAVSEGPEMAPEFQALIQTIDTLNKQQAFQEIFWPYHAALVLHQHGLFEDSRARLMNIIDHPTWTDEPLRAQAARLVVESHILAGERDRAQERASFFSEMTFSENSTEVQGHYFTLIGNQSHLPQAAVLQAESHRLQRAKDARWRVKAQEAVVAYEAILNDSNGGQFRDLEAARLSALALHRSLGQSVEVRAHIQALLNEQPNHPQRMELHQLVAESYMAQLDYENAIDKLEELYADLQAVGSQDEAGLLALRTAAWLRQSLGQHATAAENYERFGRENPTHSQAGESLFWAGRLWEQTDIEQAKAFYTRFIQSPLNASADTQMHAHLRLAALNSERKDDQPWTLSLETAYLKLQAELHPHHPAHGLRDHDQIDRLITKMDELLAFELGTDAAVNLRQLAARKKAFDRFIQKAAAFWDHGTHGFDSKSRLWAEIGDRWLLLAEKTEAHLDHLVPDSFAVDALSKDIFVVEIYSYMVQPFRNSATAYYEQTLKFGQQGQWWSTWQVHAANALNRAWPTEHPTPQVDWAPTRDEILASISLPNPQGPATRMAQAKTSIRADPHNLRAYADLVEGLIEQATAQPLQRASSLSHAWSLIQIAESQIPGAKTHPSLQFQHARLYELEGNPYGATEIWQDILESAPQHHPTAAAMGIHFLEQKHLPRALELIEKATTAFPESVPLRLAQAHAYYDMGQAESALEALSHAQAILPHSIDIVVAMATVHGILLRDQNQALTILAPLQNDSGEYPAPAQQLVDQMNQNALRVKQLDTQQQVETDVAQRAEEAARILQEADEDSDIEDPENNTQPTLPPIETETKQSIGQTLQNHRRDVQHCYRLALKDQPDLSGMLVLGFDIEGGMAANVTVDGLNRGIQDCIRRESKQWDFRPIVSASSIEIRFNLGPN